MENYIIDVNILFSGLLSRKPFYATIFSKYHFFTPDFALLELEKYRSTFLKKVKSDERELFEMFGLKIFSNLSVIPDILISDSSKIQAQKLCEGVDIKDFLYVALSIQLDMVLLTRDKPLFEHLWKMNYSKIMLFDDFLNKTEGF